jgi:hypothetical protein
MNTVLCNLFYWRRNLFVSIAILHGHAENYVVGSLKMYLKYKRSINNIIYISVGDNEAKLWSSDKISFWGQQAHSKLYKIRIYATQLIINASYNQRSLMSCTIGVVIAVGKVPLKSTCVDCNESWLSVVVCNVAESKLGSKFYVLTFKVYDKEISKNHQSWAPPL